VPHLESCDDGNIQDKTPKANEMHYLFYAK
jgi:hypothetical protein